jgi:hypothetical protein
MTPEAKRLREKLLGLSESDRMEVATDILASVGAQSEELSAAERERLWLAEAERRWREIVDGKAETRPAEDVLREARERLR